MAGKKYQIPAELVGKAIWTEPPTFERKVEQPGKFELDKCNQKELAYLVEVIGIELQVEA